MKVHQEKTPRKVACVGQMVTDIITKGVWRIPKNGEADVIESVSMKPGGCALTCARVLDQLGVPVAIFGLLGEDPQGRFLMEELRHTDIDTSGVRVSPDVATTTSVIVTDAHGERSFLYAPGSVEAFQLAHIDRTHLEKFDLWHFPGVSKLLSLDICSLLDLGKAFGKIRTMDTDYDASGHWYENVAPYLESLDYFLPSYDEAHRIAGRKDIEGIAGFFLEKGVQTVVIKLGPQGCYARNAVETVYSSGYQVDCVDTTGAGDSFVAGFLSGVVQGWNLQACCDFANGCGALSVMAIGAGGKICDRQSVLTFMSGHAHFKTQNTLP